MAHYIALIHKQADSCYGVSFPDVPGVTMAGDTIDEAIQKAGEVLEFAAEDWTDHTGREFPQPRTIDDLRADLIRRFATLTAKIDTGYPRRRPVLPV